MNPGKTGFSNLHSTDILWWRWWEVGLACQELGLQLVALPGPRIPPGTKLPDGFPYTFLGSFSSSWSTVAVLLAPEIAQAVELCSDVGNERRMWFTCRPVGGGPSWLLAAIYAPPGGDVPFWVQLLDEWVYLRRLLNIHATFIFGDLNIHLPYLVQHDLTCHCLHCRPSIVDREIQQMRERASFKCCNPVGVPTHQSGTTIDGFLTDLGHGLPPVAVLPPGTLAGSDHSLVSSALPLYVSPRFHTGFGRVRWVNQKKRYGNQTIAPLYCNCNFLLNTRVKKKRDKKEDKSHPRCRGR